MRILLLGAGGFIGRHILAELLDQGHRVRGIVRRKGGLSEAFADAELLEMDLATATAMSDWAAPLTDIHLVINAAGVLSGRSMDAIHVAMPRALYATCVECNVRRVVLISAISARPDVDTDYSRSKLAGERLLQESPLRGTVLRPSLVYGDGSYGGTSLMRGMAGAPFAIPLPGKGEFPFTPIHARDLAKAVRLVCERQDDMPLMLEPVGPETLSLATLLARYRAWLGFGQARFVSIPMPLMRVFGRLGDLFGGGPIATNSLAQMGAGNAGNSTVFAQAIGFQPRSFGQALTARPAQVQDRWHARLFFLAPALKWCLLFIWFASAFLGLFAGHGQSVAVVEALGLPSGWASPLQIGGSVLDLVVAALLLWDRRGHIATMAQLAIVLGYTLVIGIALPGLWLDPFGPMLKNLPIMLAILVHGAIADQR